MHPPVSAAAGGRTRDAAGTRARLLDATVALLVESGYAKTSTWAVCARAGASRGALLHHFPTRSSLLAAAVDHLAKVPLDALDAALKETPARDQPAAFLNWLWGTLDGDLFVVGLELLTAARTEPELRAIIRLGGDLLQERLEATVAAIAAANGETEGGDLANALLISVFATRGIGLDIAVGGDRAAHHHRFVRWRARAEGLVRTGRS